MARPSVPGPLEQLRRADSPATQLAALKQLKNDLVGHERRKESAVRDGIVVAVSSCFKSSQGKRQPAVRPRVDGSSASFSDDWDVHDQISLQCVFLVTSLAHGKPKPPADARSFS
jgi:armadillo repeat-containing protein 8